jgi:uncharacterized circularly permuted ATP-grasp superfamily protein/uncharacterized alpha-E superfamily protein
MQSLLNQFSYESNHYNELLDANGQARPHWQALMTLIKNEPASDMHKRMEAVQRQVRENGVTYNVYADNGLQRPWGLDVLPFIIGHDEWEGIAAAVAQRATLLNQVLMDVYGAQTTIKRGLLPSALVHGHSGFLRPCHGFQHHDQIALHSYAVDIVRAPNGRWWAVSDRTQSPTGAGYALENRTIISSAFPDLFRDINTQRLSGFFSSMRDSLSHWGRLCAKKQSETHADIPPLSLGEQPLIVILTPGPYNETYHEQSFLAGYLGFPLVQGNDLTVRNGVVWLKTISGLKAVHVLLRRVDDDYCDPIEFIPNSFLGVPGITEVARQGNVVVANALGSNLLQSGALLGFLPKLSQTLLGEQLKMPSVATWWCGESKALEYVITHLHELVIKPAFPQIQEAPIFGEDLDAQQKLALINKLTVNPQNYIAQEQVNISQAPAIANQGGGLFNTLGVGLRVFAFATPNGYAIMPGGLARVASSTDSRVITMQRGGVSKDTWVTSPYKQSTESLLRKTTSSKDLVRGNTYLSSRMVENLFWYGRYTIRNTQIAALLRTAIRYLVEYSPENRALEWPTIYRLCVWYELIPTDEQYAKTHALTETRVLNDQEIEALLIDAVFSSKGNSLSRNVQHFFQQAFILRERLSQDHWRTVNRLSQQFLDVSGRPTIQDALEHLDFSTSSFVAITGFALDWMTRDQGWRFMSIGRRLERLQFLCVTITQALEMPAEGNLEWLLVLSNNVVTYRARYSAQPEWLPVLDLILLDDKNPNAMIFQLNGLVKYLAEISSNYEGGGNEGILMRCLEGLKALDQDVALVHGSPELLKWLDETYTICTELSNHLTLRFFSYTSAHSTASVYS